MAGGFLVVDVVALPSPGTEPRVQSIALAGTLAGPSGPGAAESAAPTAAPSTETGSVDAAAEVEAARTPSEPATPVPDQSAADVQAPAAALTSGPEKEPAALEPATVPAEPAADDEKVLATGVLETDDFTIAGVTWDSAARTPESVEVRVREGDGWSDWSDLKPNDEGPDAGTEEFDRAARVAGTDPLVTDGADAVEVRVTTSDGVAPAGLEVSLVDPGTAPGDEMLESSTPLSAADAASAARPSIISRAAWGADESLRSCSPSYSSDLKAATLHHTAGSNSYTYAGSAATVRGIYAYHTRTLGWCDIGYNFLVDKWGRIYEGRAGGVDRNVRGAHAGGFNNMTVGLSLMGNYDLVAVPAAMQKAVTAVVAWKLGTADIDPQGSTVLTSAGGSSNYSSGTKVSVPTVFPHRQTGSTACPGRYGVAILPAVRRDADLQTGIGPYVTAVYADMLKRSPDAAGLTNWAAMIAGNGGNATPMMTQFTASVEYRNQRIDDAYGLVLGRATDSNGLEHWRTKVIRGQVQLEDIAVDLFVSQEFYNAKGGTDAGFVRGMYRTVLGREVDSVGLAHWVGVTRSRGRAAAVLGIWDSYEATGRRVDGLYRNFLKRGVDSNGYGTWTRLAQTRGDYWVRDQLVLSAEYRSRASQRY